MLSIVASLLITGSARVSIEWMCSEGNSAERQGTDAIGATAGNKSLVLVQYPYAGHLVAGKVPEGCASASRYMAHFVLCHARPLHRF